MLTYRRPLRVAVLSSRRCPGAEELLADPARGRRWELVCALSSEEEFETLPLFLDAGIPFVSHPVRDFHRRRGRRLSDLPTRRACDAEAAARLAPYRPDLLFLSSYLYVATPSLLDVASRGAVNIHGSDLAAVGADGAPKYAGLRAVADAILAGETETRATAHWVTEDVDRGPIIARSGAYPVPSFVATFLEQGNLRAVKAYAYAHQEWMLAQAWGPLFRTVLREAVAGAPVARTGIAPAPASAGARA